MGKMDKKMKGACDGNNVLSSAARTREDGTRLEGTELMQYGNESALA